MIPNISPFNPGDKVVAYCRYSEGDDQGLKNQSTEEQSDAIRRFCDQNNLQLVKVFADPFASGRSVAKRDHYLEMLSFLLHGKKKPDIQGVVLWDYERYGRNYDRAQYDAAQLRMKGYKLFSMQQPIAGSGPFDHVLESMYFASAQNQSDMISADVRRALQANFTKWHVIPRTNIPDGWVPVPVQMGYLTDGTERIGYRAVPDPEYKDKIREAIEERLKGASVTRMRTLIGGKFAEIPIKCIALMKKPLLYGSMTYGGTTIEDYCEPIIDKETFDKLQVYNAAQPKRRRSPGAGVYSLNRSLLSGLLICGVCGSRMHLDRRKAKGHTYETYFCNNYHVGIRRDIIEPMILEKAVDLLSGEQWENDYRTLTSALRNDPDTKTDKSSIQQEIAKIDRSLTRLSNVLLDTDKAPSTIVNKMNELEAKRKEVLERMEEEDGFDNEKIRDTVEKVRSRILTIIQSDRTSTDEKREALSLFIQSIIITAVPGGCECKVNRGLPGFLSVASNCELNIKRPWSLFPDTRNFLKPYVFCDLMSEPQFGQKGK